MCVKRSFVILCSSGWGLRTLNDIPAGGFLCIYAGQLLNDEGANEVDYFMNILINHIYSLVFVDVLV